MFNEKDRACPKARTEDDEEEDRLAVVDDDMTEMEFARDMPVPAPAVPAAKLMEFERVKRLGFGTVGMS